MTVKTVKHTAGPWFAEATEPNPGRKVYSGPAYDAVICEVHDYDTPEGIANARLLAESPALLAVCKEAKDTIEICSAGGVLFSEILTRLAEVIAKAEDTEEEICPV